MKPKFALHCCVAAVALAIVALAADDKDKKDAPKAAAKNAGFERIKQLAGEWAGRDVDGLFKEEIRVHYKVTAAGSAVVETLFPGSTHEMVTVYHQDGDDLLLTHYCAAGNQPRMRAERGGDANKIAFKFAGATNMKSENDMHMHEATITFPDNDTIKSEWTHYKDNKATGTVKFELKRAAKQAAK